MGGGRIGGREGWWEKGLVGGGIDGVKGRWEDGLVGGGLVEGRVGRR